MSKRRWGLVGVAYGVVLCCVQGVFAGGSLEWETTIELQSVDPIVVLEESDSILRFDYGWGDVALGSQTGFGGTVPSVVTGENGAVVAGVLHLPMEAADPGSIFTISVYGKEDLVIEWPVGTWGLSADASFGLVPPTFLGLATRANVTAYGTSLTVDATLRPSGAAYATGLTFELSGTTLSGMGIALTGRFGASTAPGAPPPSAPCALDFREAEFFLDGFPWGCVYVGFATVVDTDGFDRAEIAFDLSLWDGVLGLDGELVFETQTKTLTLAPSFQFGAESCVWVNVGVDPDVIWGSAGSGAIQAIVVRGVGITGCEIGATQFSGIASIAGNLYKSRGADDIDLRATGYYIALSPSVDPSRFEVSDYDMVWTFEYGFNDAELAVDVYFDAASMQLFDLALITGEYVHQISSNLALSLGAQVDPTGVLHRLILGFSAAVVLP